MPDFLQNGFLSVAFLQLYH